ncbi:hypothetical protein [Vulcanisaeta souniana]|uniref:hypothetical protein n=1 Tax=Vulcanisaeta souniana TaxID=164452 RepID=UPI000B1227C2|nr:hypothetical protein [Vulcanisaeta souniana]
MADMDNVIKCMATQLRNGDITYTGLASVPAILAIELARYWGLNTWFINVAEIYEPKDIVITPSSGGPILIY